MEPRRRWPIRQYATVSESITKSRRGQVGARELEIQPDRSLQRKGHQSSVESAGRCCVWRRSSSTGIGGQLWTSMCDSVMNESDRALTTLPVPMLWVARAPGVSLCPEGKRQVRTVWSASCVADGACADGLRLDGLSGGSTSAGGLRGVAFSLRAETSPGASRRRSAMMLTHDSSGDQ
jgi:hypothetical protein